MPLDEPSWWYSGGDDWRARALQPIARVYGWGAMRRFAKAKPYRADRPVICVGNFTAGGTGKTPLSLLLAEMLKEVGKSPVFLTRGYTGNLTGPVWVDPGIHDARDVGDEPMLLAAVAPTMISRDRAAGAKAITSRIPPASVIIMDDGLQNPALHKDLTLAVVDGHRGIGNGELIPAGPLRAPLSFQFSMTDAIIVNCPLATGGTDEASTGAAKRESGVLTRLRESFSGPVLAATPEPAGDITWLRDTPVIAFAGIANPQRFFRLLESLGAELVTTLAYRDHHRFTSAEMADLLARAKASGAQLVTTEKDLARLDEGGETVSARLRQATRSLPIRLAFNGNDLMRLQALIATLFTGSQDQRTP